MYDNCTSLHYTGVLDRLKAKTQSNKFQYVYKVPFANYLNFLQAYGHYIQFTLFAQNPNHAAYIHFGLIKS